MNIASVKFKGIESNIYTRTKQKIQQTTKVNNKDTVEISDLGKYLNRLYEIDRDIKNGTDKINGFELFLFSKS